MRIFHLFLMALLSISACTPAAHSTKQAAKAGAGLYEQITTKPIPYDSVFAQQLGADQYGMHQYVMAFLKKGPNRDLDAATAAKLQKAHLENIVRMADNGKLVLAGPFLDKGEIRGIYIFNVPTVEEAQALTATDPAIQAGSLVMELHPWFGSASLPLITPLHKRLEKVSVAK